MSKTHDLIVLGTGPAGSSIATRCAKEGWKVAVVEAREPGGTCALRGCNPKKVLVNAGEVLDLVRRNQGTLLRTEAARIDWSELIAFTRTFTSSVSEKTVQEYAELGIDLLEGSPRFDSPRTLRVGERRIEAAQVVIATGARPASVDAPGAELMWTSDHFLQAEELPARLLFVGAGFISFELAHVAARAGSEVWLIESGERVLKGFDAALVEKLVERTRGLGVEIRTSAPLVHIERLGSGALRVDMQGAQPVVVDAVVHGAGRVPSLDGLDLERGQVERDAGGVLVDRYLRSRSNPRVLAAGDCASTDAPALTPVANAHAHALTRNLLGGRDRHEPDVEGVAAVVFTTPALASVGLSVESARRRGVEFELHEGDLSSHGSVRKLGETHAGYRILLEPGSGRILGAHLLGPRAEETINLFSLAMRCGASAKDLRSAPLAFPTFGHEVRSML